MAQHAAAFIGDRCIVNSIQQEELAYHDQVRAAKEAE